MTAEARVEDIVETPPPPDGAAAGGLWSAQRRALTLGLVLTITFIASEALAVVTIMPVVARDLGGLGLYGWVFSAFMLGNVVGIVTAGRQADRYGPARPFLGGLVLFGAGLTIAGLAPTMLVLVGGRALQGIGAGAVPAVAYVAIGRSLPEHLRPRMMAVLSTAWVLPGLIGPAVSAAVASLGESALSDRDRAALIDGCSWFTMMTRVLIPVVRPGIVAAIIFCFLASWNEFLFALILTSTPQAQTIPVVISGFLSQAQFYEYGPMFAASVLSILPPVLVAFFFQRFLVQGALSGAVKG